MNKDDITRMAKESGFCGFDGDNKCLREFANLIAAAEREACAELCEQVEDDEFYWGRQYAEAIRARGQE
jgi:hypothetical protein